MLAEVKLVIVTAGKLQQAMHAGGDDRQSPRGAFLLTVFTDYTLYTNFIVTTLAAHI